MCNRSVLGLFGQWFAEYHRLSYWLARRWCRKLLDHRASSYSAELLEELTQDAVSRGYGRFLKRCQREVPGMSERKQWVCQCVLKGVRDAIRSKSAFGTISAGVAIRDDAMNRFRRVIPGFVHGLDDERSDALEQVGYVPMTHPAQRWEIERILQAELPASLRPTALYAAMGLTHEQSAILQGVSDRTVRNRLAEIREYLDPAASVYGVVVAAVSECLADRPARAQALPLAG